MWDKEKCWLACREPPFGVERRSRVFVPPPRVGCDIWERTKEKELIPRPKLMTSPSSLLSFSSPPCLSNAGLRSRRRSPVQKLVVCKSLVGFSGRSFTLDSLWEYYDFRWALVSIATEVQPNDK